VADGWVDQVNPAENKLFETELTVQSGSTGDPTAVPPEPVVGQNARALYRFALPNDAPDCTLESATLRLYNESPTEGRTLEAMPLSGPFKESTLTWSNQPGTNGSPVATDAHEGYQEWDVLEHVLAMMESGVSHGWQIRDANENDPEGGDQAFISREMPQDPPPATLPQLVLRYEADTSPPPEPPTPATEPTTVHCGQVLKESTLVANDLLGCPGEGLVAGASNIVIDLNGHKITSGSLVDPGEQEGLISGVRSSGKTNVVIRNGTIKGYGVLLTGGTTRHVLEDLTLDGNLLAGVELNDADGGRNGNTIQDNLFINNGEAAVSFLNGSEGSVIKGNTLEDNGGVAFQLIEADGHRFENNTVSGISTNPLVDSDAGAHLEGSRDNVFVNNLFHDFGDAGLIFTAGSGRNLVQGNDLVRNGDAGVAIQDSSRNQVIDNVVHGSSDRGVVVNNGSDTVIRDNDLRFNPSGVDDFDEPRGCTVERALAHLVKGRLLHTTWNDRCVTLTGDSTTRVRSSSMGSAPRWSNIRRPLPSRTSTRWILISSTSPAARNCRGTSAPTSPMRLSSATSRAFASALWIPSVTNVKSGEALSGGLWVTTKHGTSPIRPPPPHSGDDLVVEFTDPGGAVDAFIAVDDDRRPLPTRFARESGEARATLDRDLDAGRHIATVIVVHESGRLYFEAIIFTTTAP
jgi:parallel beta-helix repeat protein